MPDRVSMLLKIFRIELEETEKEVIGVLEYYSKRFDNHEITSYVWQENRALLKKELSSLAELERELQGWDPGGETDLARVIVNLNAHLKDLVKKRGYPELVDLVIDRISKKVSRYLE